MWKSVPDSQGVNLPVRSLNVQMHRNELDEPDKKKRIFFEKVQFFP